MKLAGAVLATGEVEGAGFFSDEAFPDGVVLRVFGATFRSASSEGFFAFEVAVALDGEARRAGREDVDETDVARVEGFEDTPDMREVELITDGEALTKDGVREGMGGDAVAVTDGRSGSGPLGGVFGSAGLFKDWRRTLLSAPAPSAV